MTIGMEEAEEQLRRGFSNTIFGASTVSAHELLEKIKENKMPIGMDEFNERERRMTTQQSNAKMAQMLQAMSMSTNDKIQPAPEPPAQAIFEFDCYVSKGSLILFLDTPEMDIIHMPITKQFNIDISGKTLRLKWDDHTITYSCATPIDVIMRKIRKELDKHYKPIKEFR